MPRFADQVRKGRLEGLRALRTRLANEIEAGGNQTAALARQLRECLREIDELEKAAPKRSLVDDLAKRRATRRATPSSRTRAEGTRSDKGTSGR